MELRDYGKGIMRMFGYTTLKQIIEGYRTIQRHDRCNQ